MSLPDGPFWRWLARRPLIQRIKRTMERWMPWGEQGLSVWDVTLFFVAGMMNGAVSTRAAAISFRLFLAFFPAIIVLLSILPHTPLETEAVMDALLMFFPGDTVSLFEQTVADLLGKTQGALLSVGFALTLYYASSSVHAVLSGFNESALLDRRSNPWLMRVWAMFLMVLKVVMLGLAVLIIGFSGDVLQWMEALQWLPGEGGVWVDVARWTGATLLIYASVTLLFNVGHLERLKWRTLTPGASMTTLLIVLLSVVQFLHRPIEHLQPALRFVGNVHAFVGLGQRQQHRVVDRLRVGREHRKGTFEGAPDKFQGRESGNDAWGYLGPMKRSFSEFVLVGVMGCSHRPRQSLPASGRRLTTRPGA